MGKNIINFFHALIIAGILLSLNGCGYKAPPTYVADTQKEQQINK